MNKTLIAIVVIIIILIGGWYVYQNQGSAPATGEPIKIGFIGPLTGDGAAFGETERNATMIAVDEINVSGGVDGQPIEVVYEDGRCAAKDALTSMQKLLQVDKVQIVMGGTCSSETLAIAPIAEANKVILFSAFSSNPQVTDAGDYIFRNAPSDKDVAKLDADVIAAKYKKVAMISENNDYAQGVREIMKAVFATKGVTVVADEVYSPQNNNSDFRGTITKIKQSNPEVIYINPGSSPKAGGLIAKQVRDLGITVPIHGNFNIATQDSIDVAAGALEGAVSNDGSKLSSKGVAVLEEYKKRFSVDPVNEYEMGAAYDRVYILKKAIQSVGYDTDKIKDFLYSYTHDGAIGTYHFDSNGDVVGVGFISVVIKDGKPVTLEE